jgi:hypothetical protein
MKKPEPKSQSGATISFSLSHQRVEYYSLPRDHPTLHFACSSVISNGTISRGRQGKEGWQPMVSLCGYSKVLELSIIDEDASRRS